LYIPLGGNRIGVHRTNINLMLTMVIGGLWHGAAWTFVFWGFLHGLYLGIERFFKGKFKPVENLFGKIALAFLTFTAVNFTWVFFRAESFSEAWNIIKSMLFLQGTKAVLQSEQILIVAILTASLFLFSFFMRKESLSGLYLKLPSWFVAVLWGFMLFGLIIVQSSGQQFIYFQF